MQRCACEATEKQFGARVAERDLKRYRRHGPYKTTRILLNGLKGLSAEPKSLLDIGGGIGAIAHELLGSQVRSAILVEVSNAYIDQARAEAGRRGHGGRIDYRRGDFVELADELPAADLVTLDRAVCCYPDLDGLVRRSAAKARKWYGLSYPRDRWYVRLIIGIQNLVRGIQGNSFRTYVHSELRIQRLLEEAGLQERLSDADLVWRVGIYARTDAAVHL